MMRSRKSATRESLNVPGKPMHWARHQPIQSEIDMPYERKLLNLRKKRKIDSTPPSLLVDSYDKASSRVAVLSCTKCGNFAGKSRRIDGTYLRWYTRAGDIFNSHSAKPDGRQQYGSHDENGLSMSGNIFHDRLDHRNASARRRRGIGTNTHRI
jgi:hypothetical protein